MVVAVCCAAAVPLTGIIAAIAVPGLLRARMSGNETVAVGSLRAIHSAQVSYFQTCGGYAPNLPALTRPRQFLSPDLTGAETVLRSGYNVTLAVAEGALITTNVPNGCEGAVSAYVAYASLERFGATGMKYFATDGSGTIYQDESASFDNAIPMK